MGPSRPRCPHRVPSRALVAATVTTTRNCMVMHRHHTSATSKSWLRLLVGVVPRPQCLGAEARIGHDASVVCQSVEALMTPPLPLLRARMGMAGRDTPSQPRCPHRVPSRALVAATVTTTRNCMVMHRHHTSATSKSWLRLLVGVVHRPQCLGAEARIGLDASVVCQSVEALMTPLLPLLRARMGMAGRDTLSQPRCQ